jgi:hypothetical protein
MIGGDGDEVSLLLDSIDGKRIRRQDSRQLAYDAVFDRIPSAVLERAREAGLIDVSPETMMNIGVITSPNTEAMAAFARMISDAGLNGLAFAHKAGRLNQYHE